VGVVWGSRAAWAGVSVVGVEGVGIGIGIEVRERVWALRAWV